jgi:hypothetical protein
VAIHLPDRTEAGIYFIGRIRTPWQSRAECPKRGDPVSSPVCTIEVDDRWQAALSSVDQQPRLPGPLLDAPRTPGSRA